MIYISTETHRQAQMLVDEMRKKRIREFEASLTVENYFEKMEEWKRISKTII